MKDEQKIFLWRLIKDMEGGRNPELIEELAEIAHSFWVGWMHRMFSLCDQKKNGVLIPFHLSERWKRQMSVYYTNLPEEEKESDREVAALYLDIVQSYFRKKRRALEKEQIERDKKGEG